MTSQENLLSHYNLFCMSWRVCLYAFLALRLPRPLTCAHIRVRRHLPRRFHYFPAHRLLWFPPAVFSWGLWPPARQRVPGVQAPDPVSQQVLACSSCSTTPQAAATRTKQVELGIAQPFQAAGLYGDPIGWERVKIPRMPVPALGDIWRRPAPLAALLQAAAAAEDWPLQAGDAAGLRCWFSALLSAGSLLAHDFMAWPLNSGFIWRCFWTMQRRWKLYTTKCEDICKRRPGEAKWSFFLSPLTSIPAVACRAEMNISSLSKKSYVDPANKLP